MRYVILANPVSGRLTVEEKRRALEPAARVLGCGVHGLDTTSASELGALARELAGSHDAIVVAGGDGTFSDVINNLDTTKTALAFLPLGTGNALRHALRCRGGMARIAERILEAPIRECDLIDCGGRRRAFMIAVGIDGTVIRLSQEYKARGIRGGWCYIRAMVTAFLREYRRCDCTATFDGETRSYRKLLSFMVVKQPYLGLGMKVLPGADFSDGLLHVLVVNQGLVVTGLGIAAAMTFGNPFGDRRRAREVVLRCERPLILQIDGNVGWEANEFRFTVLPGALKLKA
jgi:diacylglycerol kinase family enzyme